MKLLLLTNQLACYSFKNERRMCFPTSVLGSQNSLHLAASFLFSASSHLQYPNPQHSDISPYLTSRVCIAWTTHLETRYLLFCHELLFPGYVCISYLLLHNIRTPQTLVVDNNGLWFLRVLWVDWAFLCWYPQGSLIQLHVAGESAMLKSTR